MTTLFPPSCPKFSTGLKCSYRLSVAVVETDPLKVPVAVPILFAVPAKVVFAPETEIAVVPPELLISPPVTVKSPVIATLSLVSKVIVVPPSEALIILPPT